MDDSPVNINLATTVALREQVWALYSERVSAVSAAKTSVARACKLGDFPDEGATGCMLLSRKMSHRHRLWPWDGSHSGWDTAGLHRAVQLDWLILNFGGIIGECKVID